jgi:hypothetical protein
VTYIQQQSSGKKKMKKRLCRATQLFVIVMLMLACRGTSRAADWTLVSSEGPLAYDESFQWASPSPFANNPAWDLQLTFDTNKVSAGLAGGVVDITWTAPLAGPLAEPAHIPFTATATLNSNCTGDQLLVQAWASMQGNAAGLWGFTNAIDCDVDHSTPNSGEFTLLSNSGTTSVSASPLFRLCEGYSDNSQLRAVLRFNIANGSGSQTYKLAYIYTWQRSEEVTTSTTTTTVEPTTTVPATTTTSAAPTTTVPEEPTTTTTSVSGTTTTTTPDETCPGEKVLGADSPQLENMRAFRDSKLAQSAAGRRIIHVYYTNANSINAVLDRSPALRAVARQVLEIIAAMAGRKQ